MKDWIKDNVNTVIGICLIAAGLGFFFFKAKEIGMAAAGLGIGIFKNNDATKKAKKEAITKKSELERQIKEASAVRRHNEELIKEHNNLVKEVDEKVEKAKMDYTGIADDNLVSELLKRGISIDFSRKTTKS